MVTTTNNSDTVNTLQNILGTMQYYEQFSVQLYLHIRQNATAYDTDSVWFRRQLIALISDCYVYSGRNLGAASIPGMLRMHTR